MNETAKIRARRSPTISLFKWVWRSYLRTSLVPLLMVEVVIVAIYLLANHFATEQNIQAVRAVAEDELQRIAQREVMVIQQQLSAISHTADMFRRQAALALQTPYDPGPEERGRYAYTPDKVNYHTTRRGGAAVFYSGIFPVGPQEREKVLRTARLDPLMRDIQETYPLIVQIYLNTFDSLNRIYPYFDVLNQFPPRMDIPSYNFYYEADAQHNPDRRVVWTDVYVDPAGMGWMVSCIAPVYRGDFLEGVVGLDVTVATMIESILNLQIPWQGYGVLIGKDGIILALPHGGEVDWGLKELTDHHYTEVIHQDTFKPEEFNLFQRPDLVSLAAELRDQPAGTEPINLNGSKLSAWATIPETGWKLLVLVPEENIYAQANRLGRHLLQIGAWMIGGLILFYAIFMLVLNRRARRMARSISDPLEAIDHLVERIGNGHYEQPAPSFPVTELQHTAVGLVRMGQQLGVSNQRLQDAQREAEQARDEALEASRLKSAFLASVSHEIRTPMSGILGMIDFLMDTPLESEQREYALAARDSGQSLLRIINDILDFSKIEAGKTELADVVFSPLEVVEGAAEVLAAQALEKQLKLMTFVDPRVPPRLSGDAGRLRQILLNLIGNAVKFTERGEVAVRVTLDKVAARGVMLHFAVTDTGIGIPPLAYKRLFEPFTQVDGSLIRRYGGTGLGLSICKRLVDLMGGEIGMESQESVGSTFWFKLPFQMTFYSGQTDFDLVSPAAKPSAAPSLLSLPVEQPRILLAEDNSVNQKVAVSRLRKLGYAVDVVDNGSAAVDQALSRFYALILMDIQMPVMDGVEATHRIRSAQATRQQRSSIIAVTANAMEGDREHFISEGMDDYLSKPYQMDNLRKIVQRWLELDRQAVVHDG